MNSTHPLVSIIIPTYNRAHLIGETLDSVLVQTYLNWECIVVDDGSKDETSALLATYCNMDARFQYHHRPKDRPKGANACRNYGFELSKGDYIQWLDSDDLISENKIEVQINIIKHKDERTIVFCKWGLFDEKSKIILEQLEVYKNIDSKLLFFKKLYRSKGFMPPHNYLMNRKIFNFSGLWNEELLVNQDGEFMTRVFLQAKHFLFSEKAVVYYRKTSKDSTSLLNDQKLKDYYESWKLISSYLSIHFKENFPEEFNIVKWNSFIRLPYHFQQSILKEDNFYKNEYRKQKKQRTIMKKIKLLVKRFIN